MLYHVLYHMIELHKTSVTMLFLVSHGLETLAAMSHKVKRAMPFSSSPGDLPVHGLFARLRGCEECARQRLGAAHLSHDLLDRPGLPAAKSRSAGVAGRVPAYEDDKPSGLVFKLFRVGSGGELRGHSQHRPKGAIFLSRSGFFRVSNGL